jgi:hypothetical protein
MARAIPSKSINDIKSIILREGRPFKSVQKLFSDNGTSINYSGGYSNLGGGDVLIDPGRAVYVESITVGCNIPGMIFGQLHRNYLSTWIGDSLEDEFYVASDGTPITIPINAIFNENFRFSIRFKAKDDGGGSPPTQPDLSLKVNGTEFTNDMNFEADKVMLYCGDSISWSLMGDHRPHDQFENLIGFNNANTNFPANFGDKLASFRLAGKLREDGESIRLVNKGFGGSRFLKGQYYMMRNGLYDLPWNIMVMQAGVNDAREPMTPARQLTFKDRIDEFVTHRNQQGDSKYPIVFCTTPSLDDRGELLSSRNIMDVRPVVSGTDAAYTETASTTTADSDAVLNLTNASNYKCSVNGDGGTAITITGGTVGAIYRIDFLSDTNLTISDTTHTTSFIRPLEFGTYPNSRPNATTLAVAANTTMFIKCVDQNNEYEEIERSNIIGKVSTSATFDPNNKDAASMDNHFICAHSTSTKITGPDLTNVKQTNTITALASYQDYVRITVSGSNIKSTNWPATSAGGSSAPSSVTNSDVWVKVSGIANAGSGTWAEFNGFHKVVNYVGSPTVTSIDVLFNPGQGPDRHFGGSGQYNISSATVEHLDFRTYTPEFEGLGSGYFQDNTADAVGNLIDSNNYQVRVNLKNNASTFNLTAGKGIVFGLYQVANTIYMNEITSGNIVNTSSLEGAANYDAFYADEGSAKTRLFTINKIITDKVATYNSTQRVHSVNLYETTDMKDVTVTSGGRVKYGSSNTHTAYDSGFAARTYRVGDPLEDPTFKKSGDTGSNESMVGFRLHRSPKGHELLFNRLYTLIGGDNFKIPN